MIYIGFSTKTNRLYVRILCRHFRHVAPIIVTKHGCIIYQFVSKKQISLITIKHKDLKILELFGWKFIKYDGKFIPQQSKKPVNCVQWTKQACGIKNIFIQTPDSLFKYLNK